MSWALGYDEQWRRDVGYAVPAYCDHPGCMVVIDRGLAYVCGTEPFGGQYGCGLYFCEEHRSYCCDECGKMFCERCRNGQRTFLPTSDHPSWIQHKLADPSWKEWRDENADEVAKMKGN